MKLYNLFEEVILEDKNKLLTENVSDQEVIDAIKKKYNVNILYDDPNRDPSEGPTKRYIQVYNIGDSKSGNKVIRAFQLAGESNTTRGGAWKMFRIDRITKWEPTRVRWNRPVSDLSSEIPKYNVSGDRSMSNVYNKIDIGPTKDLPKPTGKSRELTDMEKAELRKERPDLFQPKKPKSSYTAKDSPKPNIKEPETEEPETEEPNVAQKPTPPIDTSKTTGNTVKPIVPPINKNKKI